MQIKKSTRKHTILLIRKTASFSPDDRYFGDDDEDVVDGTLAPDQQAGQFAFGTGVDPTAQQQFHFGDDVNMS